MPHIEPSWRMDPKWRWASRPLCSLGLHHWLRSKTLNANIACAVCSKKGKGYAEYVKLTNKDGA
jgi:hypothetical protein